MTVKNPSGDCKQIRAALTVASAHLVLGATIAWPGVALPVLISTDRVELLEGDTQWLGTLPLLPSMVLCLVLGPILEYVGKRRLLFATVPVMAASFALLAFLPFREALFLGRFIQGCIAPAWSALQTPLIADLVSSRLRGRLSSVPELCLSFGKFVAYVLLSFLPYMLANSFFIVYLIVVWIGLFFVPESPKWLVSKDRKEDAGIALSKLRGSTEDTEAEIETLLEGTQNKQSFSLRRQFGMLLKPGMRRPVAILASIFGLREFGGAFVIWIYTVFLFEKSGTNLSPFTCTVLVGGTRFLSNVVTVFILEKAGRRRLFVLTQVVCGIAMAILGGYVWTQLGEDKEPDTTWGWIPLLGVMLFVTAYGCGGPIPWVLMGEYLPAPVRSIGSSICVCVFYLAGFILGQLYPPVEAAIGLGPIAIFFAVVNMFVAVFALCLLPETSPHSRREPPPSNNDE